MIQLKNINEGVGNTRLSRFKYDTYRAAILEALADSEIGLTLKELPHAVRPLLPPERLAELGKVGWHTVSVKLDLEARGLIERVPGAKPQRLRLKARHD